MKKEKHLMFDIETLGNTNKPVITQIAAVVFSMDGKIHDEFEIKIKIDTCLMAGMNIDESTLFWWSEQDPILYKKVNFLGLRHDIWTALNSLSEFLGEYRMLKAWGNGPNFDFRHLASAYELTGNKIPWKFWNERCVRTMNDVLINNNIKINFEGEPHNAIDDCKHQIKIICKANELIYNK